MDSHIIKYITGQRKVAVKTDPSLLITERWDHSDVFYFSRTHLNQLGWDTLYNDNTDSGSDRRKSFYGKSIK
jgi:hypothetical protein